VRKGQAAMEFLMTYGWAILVVLAAVGALAYFGVLSPSRFIPEKCYLSGGIGCTDFTATTDGDVTIVLQNGAGFDMANVSVMIGTTSATSNGSATASMANGLSTTWTAAAVSTPGSKFSDNFQVTYTNEATGLAHTKTGDIVIQIP